MSNLYSRLRKRHRSHTGAVPGSFQVDPEAPKPVIHVMGYGPGVCDEQPVDSPDQLAELQGRWPVMWVNVDGLGDEQVVRRIGEIFHLHPLALADTVHTSQRAKVDEYDEHAFCVIRMATPDHGMDTEQVSLFLRDKVVLTFQERPGDCLDPVRQRIRSGLGRIRTMGADYLAYALMDSIVDGYFPVLEDFGEQVEQLENDVIHRPREAMIGDIHGVKRSLLNMRRATWPLRDALTGVLHGDIERFGDQTRLFMRDLYDHVTQVIDTIETYRELASGLLDVYLSSMSNRMNEVMKVLTIIATIFIPLSFVAGLYGMNFNPEVSRWNMPELSWAYGYPAALALMALIAFTMLYFFWTKGWLGRKADED
ncbi:MAG: magnesium/cobalt transporter CorA [Phycisphaerae bacterium]